MDRRTFLGLGLSGLALAGGPAPAALARDRQPAAEPAVRWAMAVDLRRCLQADGCRDCLTACHASHNVPDIGRQAHEVKWIWREAFTGVFPEHGRYAPDGVRGASVPIFCNHCASAPCVRVCPTQATWTRADGIVMMDWHRCIGCRYCMAACPYGSRSFNWLDPRPHLRAPRPDFPTRTVGVVEKCTFCEERLARGEPPACVAACRQRAMIFGNLRHPASEIREVLRARASLRRRPELGTEPA
ncbi:MAG: sulfate reduction electron transfer complex DsrMKJOP subunit DsrO, partial [Candidatus Methylomirabilales bacterium]